MKIGDSFNSALSQLGSNISKMKESAGDIAKEAELDSQADKMKAAEAAKAGKAGGAVDVMA